MKSLRNIKQQVDVCLGQAGIYIGSLIYEKQGSRENAKFTYTPEWLANPDCFVVSPDLDLRLGYQFRKAPSSSGSTFHFAFADTAPDAWGRRVIQREHAKRRRTDPTLRELTELDFLLAVDDFSRIGALRLRDNQGVFQRTTQEGKRTTPPIIELEQIYTATRAVEKGQESAEDLKYLMGKGTSLGGVRPKCTVIDESGMLAIGKFPSVSDTRSVTRGEVLALQLAKSAGIDAANSRIVVIQDVAVAIIERFDRTLESGRIPYLSAGSMLQASRQEDRTYTEIADVIRAHSPQPTEDVQQLWRRMVFNLLITNIDDHLQNLGFLHLNQDKWKLAPAFDINPFLDKDRESKTWLSEDMGPVVDVTQLIEICDYFALTRPKALKVLGEVHQAVANWRTVALSASVGLQRQELDDFAPAFEHDQMEKARELL
jgi:serine/threonine-protein kinase HipA